MYANRFIGFSLFGLGFSSPYKAAPFSHLLPDTNISVSENLFIVSRHLFEQPLHLRTVLSTLMFSSCFKFKNSDKKLFYLAVSPYWISSRVLREMIHEGRSVRYLVTEEIRKYIDENKLYRE
mgnify:CR=1 FL=1